MAMLMRWYLRLRLRRLERLLRVQFDEKLSNEIDACVTALEAVERLR